MVLEVENALLPTTLLLLDLFPIVFLRPKFLLEVNCVDEETDLRILTEHLILKLPPALHNLGDLLIGEQLFSLVEVQLIEHVLHHLVHFVCHTE